MKKMIVSTVLLFVIFTTELLSQTAATTPVQLFPSLQTIGLQASSTSGSGLFYKIPLSENFNAKVAGFVFFNESSDNADSFFNDYFIYNVGLELQRTLFRTRDIRFYALAGVHYMFDRETIDNNYYGYPDQTVYTTTETDRTVRGGLGLGIELLFFDHFSLHFDGGYNLYNEEITKTTNNPSDSNKNPDAYNRGGGIGGGIGIGFSF